MKKMCSHSGIPCEHGSTDGSCHAPYNCPYSYDADIHYTVSTAVGADGDLNNPQEESK